MEGAFAAIVIGLCLGGVVTIEAVAFIFRRAGADPDWSS
jgi:hypothetical protein